MYITENSNKKPKSPECPRCPECPKSTNCPKSPKCSKSLECSKSPDCPKSPESPDCDGEKLSDLSEYQKLQYQRDVKGVWISGKNHLLKFSVGSMNQ